MKQLRSLSLVVAAVALCSASLSHACDQDKAKNTTASKSTRSNAVNASYSAKKSGTSMGAACSAEMAAACASTKGAKNVTAANGLPDCCAAKGVNATTASNKSAARMTVMNAGADGCGASHGAKTSAMAAGAGASCSAHGKNTAMAAGSDASCGGKGMVRTSGHTAHAMNCDACADMDACDMALREMGAVMQVVPLKNGVMFVYTTDATKTRSIQQTMAQRKEQMAMFASSSSKAHLCGDCKQMRGAAMSGKLAREIVNIEGGCLSLMTSSDPAIVARIHALAGVAATTRAKI